ncbi:tyrosine-type recombinase/integrase [Thaumasiovibrio sp. DFM-14]|uniref:tyrosine-type recombinase/integrase n=1 Tax=Thaumasiovibrio sp. DFM-14 TaxID=3384792 RepID=UPI0039A18010
MTPLRQRFIDEMTVRRFSPKTHACYLRWVVELSKAYHQSPDLLSDEQIREYLRSLTTERHLSGSSCAQALQAIMFFYNMVLKRHFEERLIPPIKRDSKIPELLNRHEVRDIISHCRNLKYQTAFEICYGCGLRVSEVVSLYVKDIDGVAKRLHIHKAKGGKDRFVPLSDSQLSHLRNYWRHYHPTVILFPSREPEKQLDISSMQRCFKAAKAAAGIEKTGGIHALRHAYATHQLESGMPLNVLQRHLGHSNVNTTLRYTHWIGHYNESSHSDEFDLVGKLWEVE